MLDTSYKQYTLDNGLTVALKHLDCGTIYSVLRVWQGGIDERPGEEGLAHLLEHIVATGGSKEVESKATLKKLGIFAEFGAFTLMDRTVYQVGILPRHLEKTMEYFSKSAFDPSFNEEQFEKEKKVILVEIAQQIKNNRNITAFETVYYGEDNIKLMRIWLNKIKKTNLRKASIENLINFHKRGYAPNNSDLIIVGELPDNVEEIIQKNFSEYKQSEYKQIRIPDMDPKGIEIMHLPFPKLLNKKNPEKAAYHSN